MLVRVGRTLNVGSGGMIAFDVDGTPVAVANVDGDSWPSTTHAPIAVTRLPPATWTARPSWHGSQFDGASGAVLRGPEETRVRSRRVEVQGEDLLVEI